MQSYFRHMGLYVFMCTYVYTVADKKKFPQPTVFLT